MLINYGIESRGYQKPPCQSLLHRHRIGELEDDHRGFTYVPTTLSAHEFCDWLDRKKRSNIINVDNDNLINHITEDLVNKALEH